jgi:hypothetical protein
MGIQSIRPFIGAQTLNYHVHFIANWDLVKKNWKKS